MCDNPKRCPTLYHAIFSMKILFCGVSVRALIILLLIPCLAWSESGVTGTQEIDRIEQFSRELAKGNYGEEFKLPETPKYSEEKMNPWRQIFCKKDVFNGSKECSMYKNDLLINIRNGKVGVSLFGGDYGHYPNSQSAIKVDNNKPHYGTEGSFANDQKIINQLMVGKVVNTRYKDWPYNINRDVQFDLDGFKEAYEKLRLDYRNIK